MSRVHVVYHHFPHYRAPIMRALSKSERNDYYFFGATDEVDGIRCFKGDDVVKISKISMRRSKGGRIYLHNYGKVFDNNPDAIIIIGNPNIYATWAMAIRARLRGIKVAFWTHGWLRKEPPFKAAFRNMYFSLAHRVLVYGSRAVTLAKASGFPEDKVDVIWNSLDWELQSQKYRERMQQDVSRIRRSLELPEDAIILTTLSRITDLCRYDLLVEAAEILSKRRQGAICVNMIGSGPALSEVKSLAADLNVNLVCSGEIYDESLLADHLMSTDAVVSPGKVGLTAMHALAYGVPTVTHNNLDLQMPEVEAITEGKSGALFDYGSSSALANAIESVIDGEMSKEERREVCRGAIDSRFTPEAQRALIDSSVDRMLNVSTIS